MCYMVLKTIKKAFLNFPLPPKSNKKTLKEVARKSDVLLYKILSPIFFHIKGSFLHKKKQNKTGSLETINTIVINEKKNILAF